jgi:serine/threonine protein kinase
MPDPETGQDNPSDPRDVPPTRPPSPETEFPATRTQENKDPESTVWRTRSAPPVPPPAPPRPAGPAPQAGFPQIGEVLRGFDLIRVLGKGSFAHVYLARQLSLDREVALKVSRLQAGDLPRPEDTESTQIIAAGSEARTLASLTHDHIVQVHYETVDPDRGFRLLCMQYVAGTTLHRLIRVLSQKDRTEWSGRAILEAIDTSCQDPVPLDPGALQDREMLARSDFIEAGCWIGSRLALALAHAHGLGVLHQDIKPANILLNRYGRPLLTDFNVSSVAARGERTVGGTLAYMAPEHLDAFNPSHSTLPEAVDQRSDLYGLGLVLFELLTGQPAFPFPPQLASGVEGLQQLSGQRRERIPSLQEHGPIPGAVERTVQRCLAPTREERYQSATAFAQALDGARDLYQRKKELPPGGVLTRNALRFPFWALAVLALLPHLCGSVVNISYNNLNIIGTLGKRQETTFWALVCTYNLLVYPFCLALLFRAVLPIYRGWRLTRETLPDGAALEAARQAALRLPGRTIAISCLGWLPGGLLFPLGIHLLAGPIAAVVFAHFLISFTISGLIALTYVFFGVQFLVLRVLYPRLWGEVAQLDQTIHRELAGIDKRLWFFQFLAVLIPLTGAVLMIAVGPEKFTPQSYQQFRWLVTGLLSIGMLGLGIAILVSGRLTDCLHALRGREQHRVEERGHAS